MTEAEKERAAIVAWLRENFQHRFSVFDGSTVMAIQSAANAIERLDHHKG